ncbi:MAG: aromatic ring-hydroxylating dioxygenase subunit alpha [Sphingomonadales bacterium]
MDRAEIYPRNAWYAAAWDVEVTRKPLARTLCDRSILLYRKENGEPVALADACWHRLAPLSKGVLAGDNIICPYHGLRFGPSGQCVHMPSGGKIHPSMAVNAFPAIERHRFIWLWMGDPALADPNLVPDLHWNDDPAWASDGKVYHMACDYRLVVDNLMDLTHEAFVHQSSIGQEELNIAPFDVSHDDDGVTVTRWMHDIEPPPFWRMQFPETARVDRWQIIQFEPPCTIAIDVGVATAGSGAPEGDRSQGVNGYVLNTITPESAGRCHYFWAFARNHHLGEQKWTHMMREGVGNVFMEDYHILEAQQQTMDRHPGQKFNNLNIDSGSVWARRLIDRMIARECPGS